MRRWIWIGLWLLGIMMMPLRASARPVFDLEDKTAMISASLDDIEALKEWLLPELEAVNKEQDPRRWVKLWWVYCLLVNNFSFGFSADTHQVLLNNLDRIKASAKAQNLYEEYFDFGLTENLIKNGGKIDRNMLEKNLEEARSIALPVIEMRLESELAIALVQSREYEASLRHLNRADALFEQQTDVHPIDRFVHNTNRGLILMHFEDYELAEPILAELRQQTIDLKLRSLRLTTTSSLVSAIRLQEKGQERLEEVEKLLLENLALAKEINSPWDEAQNLMGLAALRREQKRYEEALREAKAAWSIFKAENDLARQGTTALSVAKIALSLGRQEEAYAYGMLSEEAVRADPNDLRGDLDKFWADYYESLGDEQQTLQFLKKYQNWLEVSNKHKMQETARKKLAQVGLRYEQEKRRQQEAELRSQEKLSMWKTAMIILLLGVCILVFGLMRGLQKSKREIAALNQYMESQVLRRFLPPDLVQELLRSKRALIDQPQKQTLTVIFADLCAFTYSTEKLGPERVASMLNEFFSTMTEIVFRHEGTIDKFMGDGLMIFFGAPKPFSDEEQAHRALACACDMQRALFRLNETWREKYNWTYQMRIGLHQGEAIVGIFGSQERSDYTALGAAVNLASRIENLAEPDQIVISPSLLRYLSPSEAHSLGAYTIRGFDEDIELFAIRFSPEHAIGPRLVESAS